MTSAVNFVLFFHHQIITEYLFYNVQTVYITLLYSLVMVIYRYIIYKTGAGQIFISFIWAYLLVTAWDLCNSMQLHVQINTTDFYNLYWLFLLCESLLFFYIKFPVLPLFYPFFYIRRQPPWRIGSRCFRCRPT